MPGAARPTGNHEACGGCPGVDWLPLSRGNFSQYRARFHATTLFLGASAGTDSNIYYSYNQGITHFTAFSAEAYIVRPAVRGGAGSG